MLWQREIDSLKEFEDCYVTPMVACLLVKLVSSLGPQVNFSETTAGIVLGTSEGGVDIALSVPGEGLLVIHCSELHGHAL